MEHLIGFILALAVAAFATGIGLDKDRAFYPTVLMVIASYYVLFAVMGSAERFLVPEAVPMAAFIAIAAAGFKRNLWLVVAGFAIHAMFDFTHARIIANPGVPAFWPGFCLSYDLTASVCLAAILLKKRL